MKEINPPPKKRGSYKKRTIKYKSLPLDAVKVDYPLFVPLDWDLRDWRYQMLDYVYMCSKKYNTNMENIISDALHISVYRASRIVKKLKEGGRIRLNFDDLQAITKLCVEPFTLR